VTHFSVVRHYSERSPGVQSGPGSLHIWRPRDLEIPTPRWQYCLYLDQLCLDSFSNSHSQVVIVVARDSDPYRCDKATESPVVKDCSCYDEDGDEDGWKYPEIDGCRCYDVGWMYMGLWDYVRFYIDCLDNNCA
jgi:hypothetical protein